MAAELLLEGEHQPEADPVPALGIRQEAADLPEMGLILASRGAECVGLDVAEPLGEDAEVAPAEDLAGVVERLLGNP